MLKPILLLASLHVAITAGAQSNGTPREVQLKMLEHQRKVLLQMVDSMPERLYRDRVTPSQRDFAGQIHHAASAAAGIVRSMMNGPDADAARYRDHVQHARRASQLRDAAYDYAANLLQDAARSAAMQRA